LRRGLRGGADGDFVFSAPAGNHPGARRATPPFDRLRAGSESGGEFPRQGKAQPFRTASGIAAGVDRKTRHDLDRLEFTSL